MSRQMKDSGIPWIGEIPNEWETRRLKSLGSLYGGLSGKSGDDFNVDEDKDDYALYVPFTNIWNNTIINPNNLHKVKVQGDEKQNEVKKGDILFLMSSEDYDGVGKSALVDCDINPLYLNSFCKGFRIADHQANSTYLNYLLLSKPVRNLIMVMANGFIRINLRAEKLGTLRLCFPPLSEQQRIANFLDQKCGEIDEMVSLQEEIIEELKAYKQAIITEAICRGLNPDAKMKDSNIEWIGEIPKEWKMQRLKFLCKIETGNQDTQDAVADGEYPFYVRSPHVERSNKATFEGEGILMAGDGAGAGRVFHHVYGKYAVHQRVYRMSNITGINSNYLYYYISNLFCKVMDMGSAQSTVPSVRLPMLNNFTVCLPPLSEQQQITEYLDKKCSEIDAMVAIKQEKIEELKEYKKSIIYEYITGKKEVV